MHHGTRGACRSIPSDEWDVSEQPGPARPASMRCTASFFAVFLMLGGCVGSDVEDAGRSGSGDPVRLASEVLLQDERLGQPQALAVVGEHLVVLDAFKDPAVHVLRRADGTRLGALGRDGSGPREFRHPRAVEADFRQPGRFWVFDSQLGRLTRIDLDGDSAVVGGAMLLRSDQLPSSPVWAGDTLILAAGLFSGGRLGRFDGAGRFTGTVGTIPGGGDVPRPVAQHAYTGTMVARPDRSRFALLTRHADRIEIFGAGGEPLSVGRGPQGFEPVYSFRTIGGSPSMTTGDDLRFGYISAAATNDAIYALYSGRARGELRGYADYGTWLHVFDWDGELVRILKLDAYLLGIAVDPEGTTLYGTRLYPEPAVLRIPLPSGE